MVFLPECCLWCAVQSVSGKRNRGKDMAFDKEQFAFLIRETLTKIKLYSEEAEALLLGTAAQESLFGTFLYQVNGPALGVFQMEPSTEIDIWERFLSNRVSLRRRLEDATGARMPGNCLLFNLGYQIAMARIHYLRIREPLPEAGDLPGQARYWKKYYNTPKGKGREKEYIKNFTRYVA